MLAEPIVTTTYRGERVKVVDVRRRIFFPHTAERDIHQRTSSGREFIIRKGQPITPVKQIELIKAAEASWVKDGVEVIGNRHIFYGGALGGGKSHALRCLMIDRALRLTRLGYNNVRMAFCCETLVAIKRRHLDYIRIYWGWLGKLNMQHHTFTLHKKYGGHVIYFVNLQKPDEHSSVEFYEIYIDELTFITEEQYDVMGRRRRFVDQPTGKSLVDGNIISASNPGRIGHAWVYKRFIDPSTRSQYPDHYYIKALASDNPFMPPEYIEEQRRRLGPKGARALLDGEWQLFAGQYFTNLDERVHLIPPFPIPPTWKLYRAIDHGIRHPTVCVWMALAPNNTVYIYRELSTVGMTVEDFKRRVVELSQGEKYETTVVDPSMKRGQYSMSGDKTPFEVLNNPDDGMGSLNAIVAQRDRVAGWHALFSAFDYEIEEESDAGIIFKREPKMLIFDTCPSTWSSLRGLQYDDKKVDDVAKTKGVYNPGEGDDEAECVRYGYLYIANRLRAPADQEDEVDFVRTPVLYDSSGKRYETSGSIYASGF
jgi:hypothetical protein